MAPFYIGQRLSCQGSRCTVRYIGEVKNTRGSWLGVEWDDSSQGKHSGEHEGVRYFQCLSKCPTAGSFIRPSRPLDPPRSFLAALREKYVVDESATAASPDLIEISGKIVEEVGLDKIRAQLATLNELKIVLLDGLCLAGLDSRAWSGDRREAFDERVREIRHVCPNVTELDLSRNVLESWADVVGICKALPKLQSLKLNFNRFMTLCPPEIERSEQLAAFGNIKELHLDATLLTWEQIVDLTSLFPVLEYLSVASNALSSTSLPLLANSITKLNLSYNSIPSLATLQAFTSLTNLNSLSLRSNRIPSVPQTSAKLHFARLEHLDLSSNLLATQTPISHIPPIFPGLLSLLTTHNPFTNLPPDPKEIHLLTIARVGTLTSLNYSTITPEERLNAEVFYLTKITAQLSSTPASDESSIIINEHPRYPELCRAYEPAPPIIRASDATSANAELDRNTPAARLITFKLFLSNSERSKHLETLGSTNQSPNTSSFEYHTIRLPRSITPYRLKAFTGDLFGLPPTQLRLVWESNEFDPVHVPTLGSGIGNGDEANGATKWNVPDDWTGDGNQENVADGTTDSDKRAEENTLIQRGFVRREVELVDGTREVGFWVDGREARVRVEFRGKTS